MYGPFQRFSLLIFLRGLLPPAQKRENILVQEIIEKAGQNNEKKNNNKLNDIFPAHAIKSCTWREQRTSNSDEQGFLPMPQPWTFTPFPRHLGLKKFVLYTWWKLQLMHVDHVHFSISRTAATVQIWPVVSEPETEAVLTNDSFVASVIKVLQFWRLLWSLFFSHRNKSTRWSPVWFRFLRRLHRVRLFTEGLRVTISGKEITNGQWMRLACGQLSLLEISWKGMSPDSTRPCWPMTLVAFPFHSKFRKRVVEFVGTEGRFGIWSMGVLDRPECAHPTDKNTWRTERKQE